MEDEVASQLRQQISTVTNEKEAAKVEVEALKRTIDGHLLHLKGLLNGQDTSHDRLIAAVQALDVDLRGRLEAADSISKDMAHSDVTYEVLIHSLGEAQRRCQALNTGMLKYADANEEAMNSLKTLKGHNKRLVEEVQKQTEELHVLTQLTVQDLGNLSRMEETFRKEEAMWEDEADRFLQDERRRSDEEYDKMCSQLSSQLEDCWRHARVLASKAGRLREAHTQVKTEMRGFRDGVTTNLKSVERELLAQIAASSKKLQEEQAKLSDIECNLQAKLRAEHQVRDTETKAWQKRHATLTQELDDLVARRDKEVAELKAKVEAAMASREQEAAIRRKEREALCETTEVLAKDITLLEVKLQTGQRKVSHLEGRLNQAEAERDRLHETAESLRQQIRESEEALAEAVRGNKALREQMEVQRSDAHEANERDLKHCREMHEKRMEALKQAAAAEQSEMSQKIEVMEERLGMQASELHKLQEAVNDKKRQRDTLQRDVVLWKAQHELAAKMKADVERELAQFQQECVGGSLRRLQETHDELQARKVEIDKHRRQVIEEAREAKRVVAEKEATHARRTKEISQRQIEVANETERTKTALAEVESSLALAKADFAAMTWQMTEARDSLEQDISRLSANFEAEKGDLERRILVERESAESIRESFKKLRDDHRVSYKAAFDGPAAQQVSELTGAISQIQQHREAELSNLRRQSEKLRSRVEELEAELQQTQSKLEQTEQEVQNGTARVNSMKATHKTSKENLEREKALRLEELQQVQRSISAKSDQLKSLVKSGEEQKRRLTQSIEEAKMVKSRERESRPTEDLWKEGPSAVSPNRSFGTASPEPEGLSALSYGRSFSAASSEAPFALLPGREANAMAARRPDIPGSSPLPPAKCLGTLRSTTPGRGRGPGPGPLAAECTRDGAPCAATQQFIREPVALPSGSQFIREPVVSPSSMYQVPGSLQDTGQMQRLVTSMETRAANLRHDLQR